MIGVRKMFDWLKPYLIGMDVIWVSYIFYCGFVLAVIAQIIAYRHGPRTNPLLIGMIFGIGAVCMIALAGQITNVKLRDYANFIAGRTMGGGL
jgi:hypothetical protein